MSTNVTQKIVHRCNLGLITPNAEILAESILRMANTSVRYPRSALNWHLAAIRTLHYEVIRAVSGFNVQLGELRHPI
jgi:hypothetical protein